MFSTGQTVINPAAFIAIQSIPIAVALALGSEDEHRASLFVVLYVSCLGLILSAIHLLSGNFLLSPE